MNKTEAVAVIAAILAAADDLASTQANVPISSEPARFVDDAMEIYEAAQQRVRGRG